MVELDPAVIGLERYRRRAGAQLVPVAPTRQGQRLVAAPVDEVVAERDPDAEDAAERLRHRARECDVFAVDRLGEEHDVLVIGQEDDAFAFERAEVGRRREARGDAPP